MWTPPLDPLLLTVMQLIHLGKHARLPPTLFLTSNEMYVYFVFVLFQAPSGPPLNVAVFAESSTSLLVKWNPPTELERNGVITYYIIRYTSLGEESSINTTDNTTQKLIPHLRKFTEYYVTVQAVNDIGAGPPSVNDTKNTTLEDCKCVVFL